MKKTALIFNFKGISISKIKGICKLLFLIFVTVSYYSCQKNYDETVSIEKKSRIIGNDMILLGDVEPDPYKFENMYAAFNSLESNGYICPFANLMPTGTYIRVLSQSDDDYDNLKNDTTINWSMFPLDREILQTGYYYWDNSLSDSSYDWMYAVLPINYTVPDNFIIDTLYYVFIPEDFQFYNEYKTYLDSLENESYRICGALKYEFSESSFKDDLRGNNKWTPSATIRVWDDVAQQNVPLEGVKVCVKRGTKSTWSITDANGYCSFDKKFKYQVDYWIEWERHFWKIVNYNDKMTSLIGPRQKRTWVKDIGTSTRADLNRATIHRAAIIANYKENIWPITKPRLSTFLFTKKLKIRYNDYASNNAQHLTGNAYILSSPTHGNADIELWGKDYGNNYFDVIQIFNSTLHELAHWSHAIFYGLSDYRNDNVNQFISESWAQCVDWRVTTDAYPNHIFSNLGYNIGYQDWTPSVSNIRLPYTPVFIDLYDDHNQGYYNSSCPNDLIMGYSLQEIQNYILPNVHNLSSLTTSLKNTHLHNSTNSEIDLLLDRYYGIPGF